MYSSTKTEAKHTKPKHFLGCCMTVFLRLFPFNRTQSKTGFHLQLMHSSYTLHTPWSIIFVIGTVIIFLFFLISVFTGEKINTFFLLLQCV